jgi:hypothetical protein
MWATATGKRPDCGSVQFSPMCIFSPVDWTCEHYLGFIYPENVELHRRCIGKQECQFRISYFSVWPPQNGNVLSLSEAVLEHCIPRVYVLVRKNICSVAQK